VTDSNEGVNFKCSKIQLISDGAGPEQTEGIHFLVFIY